MEDVFGDQQEDESECRGTQAENRAFLREVQNHW